MNEAGESSESRSFGNIESGNDFHDSDEPSDLDEESVEEDEPVRRDGVSHEEEQRGNRVAGNVMRTNKMKTENRVVDGEVYDFYDPIRDSQRRIERERDLDSRTANDRRTSTARYVPRNGVQRASPVTTVSSKSDDEWLPQPGKVASADLKVVYDVEYRAPD